MATVQSRNKETVRKYFEEFWTNANPDIVDEFCSDDIVFDYPFFGGPQHGRDAVKKQIIGLKSLFDDISFKAHEFPLIAEGPFVVGRWIGGGTHNGTPFDGLPAGKLTAATSGRKMHFTGITIFELKDGKIVLERGEEGVLQALEQLGAIQL